jgi:hypothetical protein
MGYMNGPYTKERAIDVSIGSFTDIGVWPEGRWGWFITVVWVSPVIIIIVLVSGGQSSPFLLCALTRLPVGLVKLLLLPSARVHVDHGRIERLDRVMCRDMRRVVGRAEFGGSGGVERVC